MRPVAHLMLVSNDGQLRWTWWEHPCEENIRNKLTPQRLDGPHCVDKSTNNVNGGKESVENKEPIGASSSSVCSANSAGRASNDLTKN
ncbi:hypothetical protein L1987_48912 [Smallanthus sonchifolius]|uniref:Uncharacterized protein n=1 Tax=Smallanthus sonchifolius TaxID=185202 RepID=A0ACB9FTA7_9ASTR|nr:hypothetical protein L1987_48912 [Smallanthus sonchifolius]